MSPPEPLAGVNGLASVTRGLVTALLLMYELAELTAHPLKERMINGAK
jgi:hypothetical protein